MIQANLLLAAGAKSGGSDLATDVLRFPLGILTGVGFIAGGAILKRGNLVIGVTTAATIWVVTAIGLAFGGGQLELAGAAVAITLLVLWIFKWANPHIRREHKALLAIKVDNDKDPVPDIEALVAPLGYTTNFLKLVRNGDGAGIVVTFEIRWRRAGTGAPPTDLITALSKHYPVLSLDTEGDMAGQ
ncbi:MgtC/SapB family protein [Phyllobacterium sp. SB3]|uniref:MgtC/SapB family protein n=1 Tax=Phyllobacterium sp. SB3 TaxID=3156073 RepID=UPI0032AF7169